VFGQQDIARAVRDLRGACAARVQEA